MYSRRAICYSIDRLSFSPNVGTYPYLWNRLQVYTDKQILQICYAGIQSSTKSDRLSGGARSLFLLGHKWVGHHNF